MNVHDVINMFKDHNDYDEIDEKTFQSNQFHEMVKELLKEEDSDIEYVLEKISAILNICQYGDTSDSNDLLKISDDLAKRGLSNVRTYNV